MFFKGLISIQKLATLVGLRPETSEAGARLAAVRVGEFFQTFTISKNSGIGIGLQPEDPKGKAVSHWL